MRKRQDWIFYYIMVAALCCRKKLCHRINILTNGIGEIFWSIIHLCLHPSCYHLFFLPPLFLCSRCERFALSFAKTDQVSSFSRLLTLTEYFAFVVFLFVAAELLTWVARESGSLSRSCNPCSSTAETYKSLTHSKLNGPVLPLLSMSEEDILNGLLCE